MCKNKIFLILSVLFFPVYSFSQDINDLLQKLKNTPSDTSKIPILIDISVICDLSDIPKYSSMGLKLVEKELNKNPNSNYHLNQKAELMSNLAYYYGEQFDTLKHDSISRITLSIHTKTGNKKGKASVLNNFGYSYTTRANFVKAIEYYQASLSILKDINDHKGMALRYNNIGDIYLRLGMINEAIQNMQLSLKMYDELKDLPGQALVCSNLSNIQLSQSNITDAEKFALRALNLCRKFKANETTGTIYHNYGTVLHKKGKLNYARQYFDSALYFKKKYSSEREWINTFSSIAFIYEDLNLPDSAIIYLDSAIWIARKINIPLEIAQQLTNISQILLDNQKYNEALKNLNQAYPIALRTNSKIDLSKISYLLSKTNEKLGNKIEAYNWLNTHLNYKDSLFNDKTREITIRKSLEYEQNIKHEKDSLKNAGEIQKIELKRLKEKAEEEKSKQLLLYSIIFLMVVGAFVVYGYIRKSKVNRIILSEKQIIEKQKGIIEDQRNEIVDSISYAKRIQRSLLPKNDFFQEIFPESFIIYKPKDHLSGDFYYAAKVKTVNQEDLLLFSVADCTGHGVPGALLSVIGVIYLQLGQNLKEVNSPADALNLLNRGVHKIISKDDQGQIIRDGMDIIMGAIRKKDLKLFYATAKNSIYVLRNETIIKLTGNYFPIGRGETEEPTPFSNHEFQLEKGDILYAFTDGYADQFGGKSGKKYKNKNLLNFLISIRHLPLSEQKATLVQEFENWKSDQPQVDDICVIGIKI